MIWRNVQTLDDGAYQLNERYHVVQDAPGASRGDIHSTDGR
jgi:hypothetical protein